MPRQHILIDPGLVIETVDVGGGGELDEIAISLLILTEQDEVVGTFGIGGAIKPAARGDIDLAADNRFDAALFCRLVEFYRPKHVSMVSHGDGGHLKRLSPRHELVDFAGAIEQTVVSMKMKMDEILGSHFTKI